MKFGRNVVKKKQHKNYQDEDKKSAINKKKINSQIKKPHFKMLPIKDNHNFIVFLITGQVIILLKFQTVT